MSAMVATTTEIQAAGRSARQDPVTTESEWLKLLDVLAKPTELVERGLAEALKIREDLRAGYPRKAAVFGTNRLGLLTTLLLRLQNIEVVTLGDPLQPLLTARRLQSLPGWRHVGMSPALDDIQLVEETGARYVSLRELTLDRAKQAFGPFDVIVVASNESVSVFKATKGLAEKGVLIDVTVGDDTLEMWAARPTPCFLTRHRVATNARIDLNLYRRAVRDLALADLEHPGWLARTAEVFKTGLPPA
jgi:Glucose dehydrogenase C-terminus